MKDNHLQDVSFDFIRYANCWEDADILLAGMNVLKGDKILSIASAGDNVFALLSKGPQQVVAVDISSVQLWLCELKRAAYRRFDHGDFIAFLGFVPADNRIAAYQSIRDLLSAEAKNYWDQQSGAIENGVIHFGKFEEYFQLFKSKVLPTVHNRETVDELMTTKSVEAQKAFYDTCWNTEAWQAMYGDFFGKKMLGERGRDPQFLKHVKGDVAEMILERESNQLSTPKAFDNHFLYYILYNTFEVNNLPYYARPENYEAIKANLDALELRKGLLHEVVNDGEQFDGFNLSDIFEYMSDDIFAVQANFMANMAKPNARLVYWNLMIPRVMSDIRSDLIGDLSLMTDLKEKDKGYFYGQVIIERKK